MKVQKNAEAVALYHNLTYLLDGWRRNSPSYHRIITSKKYKHVDRFHDHRYARLSAVTWLFMWGQSSAEEFAEIVYPYGADMVASSMAIAQDIPEFFVAPSLLNALLQTRPPDSTDWKSLHFPFPAFYFILPKNMLKVGDLDILCIAISRINAGKYKVATAPQDRCIISMADSLRVTAVSEDGEEYSRTIVGPYNYEAVGQISQDPYQCTLEYADEEFLKLLPGLALNLTMAMLARPEYLEPGSKRGVDKKTGSELWTPNLIGRRYTLKTDHAETGSHASPRMHWRRGHFRQQPIGPGRSESKIIWLEPTLVSPKVKLESV